MSTPMDLATLLARVDARQYPTAKAFLAAVAQIPAAEKQYWGDDPEGVREARPSLHRAARRSSSCVALPRGSDCACNLQEGPASAQHAAQLRKPRRCGPAQGERDVDFGD